MADSGLAHEAPFLFLYEPPSHLLPLITWRDKCDIVFADLVPGSQLMVASWGEWITPLIEVLLAYLVGYETVVTNYLIGACDPNGILSRGCSRSGNCMDMRPIQQQLLWNDNWLPWSLFKVKMGITICALYYLHSTVSATMIKESRSVIALLEDRHRDGDTVAYIKLATLVIAHILVCIPFVIGMALFQMELYQDWIAVGFASAFVWFGEMFYLNYNQVDLVQIYFPPLFFVLFALVHVYWFSFPLGFTYTMFWCAYFMLLVIVFLLVKSTALSIAR